MTIKDVAEKSGVSVSTVSRVLNNHPDVSDAVRKRVLAVVNSLGYVPNNSARDLTRQDTESIGVIVRGAGNLFFTPVIHSIEKEIGRTRYTMVLNQIREDEDELLAGASLIRSKRLHGLIFLGGCFDYSPQQTAVLGVPFVCCTFTNSFGTLTPDAYSSVSIDDQAEAKRAVQYLIKHGHRKIAILLEAKGDRSISELRYRGYQDALREAGIEEDPGLVQEISRYDMASAYEGTKQLLARRNDFTAVFVIADSMAIAAMKAMYDAGKRIPEDCSVIAIDGLESSKYTIPTLTTLIQPTEVMGKKAVNALLDVIEGAGSAVQIRVETELRAGATVAEPKKN